MLKLKTPTVVAPSTFEECALRAVAHLARALDFGARREQVVVHAREFLNPWGTRTVGVHPRYPSNIGDDHSPFELSVTFGGRDPELRLLWEAQGEPPSSETNHAAALAVTARLAARYGFPIARLEAIADLYLDGAPAPPFSLWHAASFTAGRAPAFKVYLNPNARGAACAGEIVRETLARLGFARAYDALAALGVRRGGGLDALAYLSLDLDDGPTARLKVYYRHHDVTAQDLERRFEALEGHRPGELAAFCRAVTGDAGPYRAKPPQSCFSLVAGDEDGPSRATLYVPVATYAPNDVVVRDRVTTWFAANGLPVDAYLRAVDAVASRPLDTGAGLQSYVSFRREPSGLRSTVYLSPELYRPARSGTFQIDGGAAQGA